MNAVVKDNAQLEDCKPSSPYSKRILTFSGLLPFKWDDHAACSSSGHLAFLSHFLAAGGVFDRLVASCPLKYTSHNAPAVRDVLGTAVAGIVQGFNRYRHMDFLRLDGSAARLMGLGRMMSSDSVRRALAGLGGEKGLKWVWENNLAILAPLLRHPYVLDLDPTEKTVYGFQEGAEYGYNPQKAGHRGQCYHTLGIAELRLVLGVVLLPGNRTSGREALPMLEDFLDCLPEGSRPRVVRGDVGFGTEAMMALCEGRRLPFIFKVKRSVQVRRGFESLCGDGGEWAEAGEGWRGRFAELRLQGWSKSRTHVGNRAPMGTQMYIMMTNRAPRLQIVVSGILTLLSSMSILALEAFPVRVAVDFFSSTYFWTANMARVMHRSTTAIAEAPALS